MNALKIAGLLLLLMIAAGCGRIASPGDLLHAPNLANEEQSLYRAVQPFLPAGYQLTTPDQSDQGSAIRLADLDGDGEQELIVSYKKPDTDYEVNVLILNKKDGVWKKADQITGSGMNLDYLAIKPLTDASSHELLLGYDGGGSGLPKELFVYSFSGGKAQSLFHQSYEQIAVGDLLGNGLDQIALVPPAVGTEDTHSEITLIGAKNGGLAALAERRTDGAVANMRIERASADRSGLFAQILSTTRSGYAVLFAWEGGRLANVLSLTQSDYGKRASRQNLKLGRPDYSRDLGATEQKWWIDYPAQNRDVDGDGILEVALPNPLPSAEDSSGTPQLWSESYYRWDGGRGMTFVEDRFWQWGFDLRIPDRWLGLYRIDLPAGSENAAGEVRFMYVPENGKPAPLLTLRQLLPEEWERLKTVLDSSESDYVVLGGTGSVMPGRSPEITVALLPAENAGLTGEEADKYEELRLTKAEVVELAGLDTDEAEEADSNVEEH
ncbi:hypothetical protein [Saccharibacillus alkalitolerans]|uniref:VCBS repeat-containing protein n=1 Tax=Saccharibacillus alkalitolerans TaxID=2705290 RepID=A0ABX0F433_9BACL|nr:hypothetical protein [Saccharibacillus alkalitolerans]NGZ75245.1 hypothetical protein [Saccharibacillus alkalitolerans]